MADS
jgi:hypothetical protein